MRGHQLPEAYVSVAVIQPAELRPALAAELSEIDALVAAIPPRTPLPGFELAVRGHRSWDERL
jgi:hypothetical protein